MYKVYGTTICLYCDKAENLLKTKDLPFEKIYVDQDEDAKDYIVKQGFRTVPQIWLDDKWIGGYDDLVKFLNK
jgi:glutaredoxin 3|tara:strand:- start:2613 stop:2831 length:219 start_codon:yes stop_codon:yes gene_type:complete